ncbi:MAG: copper chaperone [Candidimonas sp.]|nr:MAG: copper chaperone [Candidimonas sp.]
MFKFVTFEVTGDQRLHCEKCEQRVTKLLTPLPGVRQARATAREQRIEVLLDPNATQPAAIIRCLREAGYETRVV